MRLDTLLDNTEQSSKHIAKPMYGKRWQSAKTQENCIDMLTVNLGIHVTPMITLNTTRLSHYIYVSLVSQSHLASMGC